MTAIRAQTDSRKGLGPKRPYSYTEGTDESQKLLDEEPVDVEENTPADKRSSVESVEPADDAPLFEE